jgi:hypothetical protein
MSTEWIIENRELLGLTVLCPCCHDEVPETIRCSQCVGWGYVRPGLDATCIHEWKELTQAAAKSLGIYHAGMCYHVYICTECGKIKSEDSSG